MYRFINAQKMHLKYPKTFEAPTKKELDAIKIGTSVKISSHKLERFWTTVTEINGDNMKAIVDNELLKKHPFKYGDTIAFKKHHIYSIFIH